MDAAFVSKSKPCTEDVHMYIEKYGVTWSDTLKLSVPQECAESVEHAKCA